MSCSVLKGKKPSSNDNRYHFNSSTHQSCADAEEVAWPAPHTSCRHHYESLTVHVVEVLVPWIKLFPHYNTPLPSHCHETHHTYVTEMLCSRLNDDNMNACHLAVQIHGGKQRVVGYVQFPQHSSFHTSHACRSATRRPHSPSQAPTNH